MIVWRNTSVGLGNARPCGLCAMKTIPRYARKLGLHTSQIRIYYSVPDGMHMTTLSEIMKESEQYISVGSRMRI
jgi:hypothetical protein